MNLSLCFISLIFNQNRFKMKYSTPFKFVIVLTTLFMSCDTKKNSTIILDKDSDELVYLIEMSTKDNAPSKVEDFTQSLTDFIIKSESPEVYGYFISNDGKKVTLIERWKNSQDAMQHGLDFINGPNFNRFFEVFVIESFISLGNPSGELVKFNTDNGFDIDYRKTIGGFVLK